MVVVTIVVFALPKPERVRRDSAVLFPGVRHAFASSVRQHVDEPGASLLIGLLVGDTEGLPRGVIDDFRASGLGHIVAVSGYNVTKLVGILTVIAAVCGARKRGAAVVGVVGVVLFVGVAGFSPSLVRAAVMAGIATIAMLLGRVSSSWQVMVYTAATMLLVSPTMIRDDLGFTLSFLAIIGLALYKDFFEQRFWFVTEEFGLRGVISETCAATLMVMPFSLAVFGSGSVFGVLANVLVLPLIPFLMLLGLIVVLLSWVLPVAAGVVGAVVGVPLTMILFVADFFSRFPVLEVQLALWQTIGIYSALLLITFSKKLWLLGYSYYSRLRC